MTPLMKLPLSGKPLPHNFIFHISVIVFVLVPPAKVLVVVEYGRTDGLLRSFLTDNIIVDLFL